MLENETEKQQYTYIFFFFSLNIMFADALGPPVTRSSAVITIKMQTQHPFVVHTMIYAHRGHNFTSEKVCTNILHLGLE